MKHYGFVTHARLDETMRLARFYVDKQPQACLFTCVDLAVRDVFADWLLRPDGTVDKNLIPLMHDLITEVEYMLSTVQKHSHENQAK